MHKLRPEQVEFSVGAGDVGHHAVVQQDRALATPAGQCRQSAGKALPPEVSQAFVAVWQQAIHLAQGVVEQVMDEQRLVLDAERERVAAVEDQARQDAAQFRQQAAEAVTGRQAIELRLADLELLLTQRQTQIEDLLHQREDLLLERREVQRQHQTLQQELQALRLKAEQERVVQESYVRGVEDRAHREVDRAREEGKAVTA